MENDSTYNLEWKSYFRVKPYERNSKGNIWAVYKENIKNYTSIENPIHYVKLTH